MDIGIGLHSDGSKLWNDPKYLGDDGKQKRLVWKLKDLKACTK
jgi:hypothetical protein